IKRLQALGHEVEVDANALSSFQRFAGDDATRLAAIHRAAASGADVAMISRGGYGLTRLLPDIHYKKVARAVERGMVFVGISDFTALQSALLAKTGAITWAGPALCEGFGVGGAGADTAEPDDIMQACFEDLLSGQGEGTGWRAPLATEYLRTPLHGATLWGGNLTVLTSLLGTRYFPDIRNGVLFLEDVGEHPYRVERMLTQLLHSGVLGRQKAVLLGQFTEFNLTSHDRGFNLAAALQWLRGHLKVPVLSNLPFGHVPTKVMLPVGAQVDLQIAGRDVLMLWGHL
ncbi:MAG: LD-carboxypeptidase, partial [Rhodoferax sp.]|nr:LD-carboxypeptidase [Rhodoferax sp.]